MTALCCEAAADLNELDIRLFRASNLHKYLSDQRSQVGRCPEDLAEVIRLSAKADGLRLALSYLRELTGARSHGVERRTAMTTEVVAPPAPLADPTGRSASSFDLKRGDQ